MTTHSEVLKAKLELVRPVFVQAAARVWQYPDLRPMYAEYLCTMHAIIRSTVPLMQAALGRCHQLAPADPVASGFATYLAKHIREERGHDEWVRQDLAAIGCDPDEPIQRLPSSSVAQLVGAQYYWIWHYHPICLLGHIATMEGSPPTLEFVEYLVGRTRYPRDGFRTLRRHAVLDQRHSDELWAVVDELPLRPEHVTAIGLSAMSTTRELASAFEELQWRVERRHRDGLLAEVPSR